MAEEAGESNIPIYWAGWLSLVAVALVMRFFVFDSSDDRTNFVFAYMGLTWVPVIVLNVYEGRRLMNYLRDHHHAKWEDLTTVPFYGAGGRNNFKTLPWLYSNDTLNDPVVARLKREHRSFLTFVLTVFCSNLIILPVLGF